MTSDRRDPMEPAAGIGTEASEPRLFWHLLGWHLPALGISAYLWSATGSRALMALTILFLAIVASRIFVWRYLSVAEASKFAAAAYFWTYAAGIFLFALAAGVILTAALTASPDVDAPQEPFVSLSIFFTACWCVGELYWLRVQSLEARGRQDRFSMPEQRSATAPLSAIIFVQSLALTGATAAVALSLLAARNLATTRATTLAAFCIGALALVVAVHCTLETRRLIAGVPVSEATLQKLITAIDRAALQSGAIRRVNVIDAIHTGPAKTLVMLQLEFKDGVSAQHLAPVLDKLRSACIADVPSVTDVLLMPPPAAGSP